MDEKTQKNIRRCDEWILRLEQYIPRCRDDRRREELRRMLHQIHSQRYTLFKKAGIGTIPPVAYPDNLVRLVENNMPHSRKRKGRKRDKEKIRDTPVSPSRQYEYRHLRLKNSNYFAKFSPEDHPRLSQYRWEIGDEGYPISLQKDAEGNDLVLRMPYIVLDAPLEAAIRFKNGKPLDCRRENLELFEIDPDWNKLELW